jgi:hypothetical protein
LRLGFLGCLVVGLAVRLTRLCVRRVALAVRPAHALCAVVKQIVETAARSLKVVPIIMPVHSDLEIR